MKTTHNTKIIGIDHGYGNMKTANCCFPTGITAYDHEPLFTADMPVCRRPGQAGKRQILEHI